MLFLTGGPEAHVGAAHPGGFVVLIHVVEGKTCVQVGLAAHMGGEAEVSAAGRWGQMRWQEWSVLKH